MNEPVRQNDNGNKEEKGRKARQGMDRKEMKSSAPEIPGQMVTWFYQAQVHQAGLLITPKIGVFAP